MKEYILNDIEVLTPDSFVKKAQDICKMLPITHIPVVDKGELLGCISESDFQTIENSSCISEYLHLIDFFFTYENTQILKLIKLFTDNQTNIMPVLNDKKKYIGYYELNDILEVFSASPFLFNEGVSIVVEKNKKDYSMSEATQIIEANGGKLLGLYISEKHDDFVQLTLKVISDDINEMMHTFRRYDYKIISSHENDKYLEDLKYRSEYLQKYLEM